jgi:putative transposase
MKRKRFSVEQIVAIVKRAEMGLPVAELIRRVGISEQTFYRWKKHYTGLEVDQVRQLKQLQDENGRLKKLVAELSLDERCCRTCYEETGKALTAPPGGWIPMRRVPGERAACVRCGAAAAGDTPVPEHPGSADRAAAAHEGFGAGAHSVRVPQDPGAADP